MSRSVAIPPALCRLCVDPRYHQYRVANSKHSVHRDVITCFDSTSQMEGPIQSWMMSARLSGCWGWVWVNWRTMSTTWNPWPSPIKRRSFLSAKTMSCSFPSLELEMQRKGRTTFQIICHPWSPYKKVCFYCPPMHWVCFSFLCLRVYLTEICSINLKIIWSFLQYRVAILTTIPVNETVSCKQFLKHLYVACLNSPHVSSGHYMHFLE